jgi:hypothetical protein
MSYARKSFLLILGILTVVFILSQLVLGLLIVNGRKDLIRFHPHTGYTAVALTILYVGASLPVILSIPTRRKTGA